MSLSLNPVYQWFIAEVILLRLFSLIENCIIDSALKIGCGAPYRNGNVPSISLKCKSLADANIQFKNFNRPSSIELKWTRAKYVRKSVIKIIPATEPFLVAVTNHDSIINEMRIVRNHIAHRTNSTYTNFKAVVNSTFGANLRIQVGPYLTSNKRLAIPKIDYYLRISTIIIDDLTRG